jgi:sugar-specific transcriptional regulator TrmB
MGNIPQQLISSLMELGLLESEAKIYSALVLFHDAEVKELQEFLDISKPSIYDGLRILEDRGFIVLINPKPTTYQAIPPDIVLDMLTAAHLKAKDDALKQIRKLEKEKFADDSPPNLWYVFGSKSFEPKIKDMLENARESVYCITSDRYIDHIESIASSGLKLELVVISEDRSIQKRLERVFKKCKAHIRTINKSQIINTVAPYKVLFQQDKVSHMSEALSMFEFDNMFILIVDDTECIYIPPLPDNKVNAIVTRNPAMTLTMKVMLSAMAND